MVESQNPIARIKICCEIYRKKTWELLVNMICLRRVQFELEDKGAVRSPVPKSEIYYGFSIISTPYDGAIPRPTITRISHNCETSGFRLLFNIKNNNTIKYINGIQFIIIKFKGKYKLK